MSVTVASRTTVKGQTSVGGFSPASLFLNNEQGVWYDPSDMTTMFQDFTGTTPVTAVEQPVGLLLDKSKGLILGSELVTNGDFSNGTTGWSAASWEGSVISSSGGQATISYPNDRPYGWAYQSFSTVIGATYTVSGTIVAATGNPSFFGLRKADNNDMTNPQNHITFLNSVGSVSGYKFIATSTTTYIIFQVNGSGATITVDNISVKLLPGNHAYQSTSANRPVLSARVNLLTYTEQFDNAAWGKEFVTVTPDAVIAPDGTTTADKLVETVANNVHDVYRVSFAPATYSMSVYAKSAERSWIKLENYDGATDRITYFDLSNGVLGTVDSGHTATISSVGNGWYRCTINFTVSGSNYVYIGIANGNNGNSYAGDTSKGVYIWGADLRFTNQGVGLPVYQRVGAAVAGTSTTAGVADYDTTNFPMYLKFDGSNDSLATGNINFTSTNKMSVFAGERKTSDNQGMFAELSVAGASNNGTFSLFAPLTAGVGNYGFRSRWDGTTGVAATASSYPAPITNILTGIGDIPADNMTLRVNGSVAATDTGDQGTGNFGTYPIYIGARAGTSLFFAGNLYGLIVRGASSNTLQIAGAENWLNQKTKAYA